MKLNLKLTIIIYLVNILSCKTGINSENQILKRGDWVLNSYLESKKSEGKIPFLHYGRYFQLIFYNNYTRIIRENSDGIDTFWAEYKIVDSCIFSNFSINYMTITGVELKNKYKIIKISGSFLEIEEVVSDKKRNYFFYSGYSKERKTIIHPEIIGKWNLITGGMYIYFDSIDSETLYYRNSDEFEFKNNKKCFYKHKCSGNKVQVDSGFWQLDSCYLIVRDLKINCKLNSIFMDFESRFKIDHLGNGIFHFQGLDYFFKNHEFSSRYDFMLEKKHDNNHSYN